MTNAYPRPDSARTPQDEGSTPPSVLFQTGFVTDLLAQVGGCLRALQADRTEDLLLGLERLERQLAAQAQWEQADAAPWFSNVDFIEEAVTRVAALRALDAEEAKTRDLDDRIGIRHRQDDLEQWLGRFVRQTIDAAGQQ